MNDDLSSFLAKKQDDFEKYHEKILTMLGDEESYGWAEITLSGILEYIEEKGQITEKQKQAVDNIYYSYQNE